MTARWPPNELRQVAWDSQLCVGHKLVLLGVLSYMGRDRPFAFPGLSRLGARVTMSRTKVAGLLPDLLTYDWLAVGDGQAHMPRPGRRPTCFYTPCRDVIPQVPEHCLKPSRVSNLKRRHN